MRKISFVILLTGLVCTLAYSQTVRFDNYFIDKTMRIDYYHIGMPQPISLPWTGYISRASGQAAKET